MGLSRLVAMVVRTAVVAGVACLMSAGPVQGSALAAVKAAPSNGLTDNDVLLIERVHQASLVEIWAGERAAQFASSPAVKWVGRGLLADHEFLDEKVAEAARKFDVSLPKEPTLQQQAGVRKMARVSGPEFDRAFANALHFGHSQVLPIAQKVVAEDSPNPTIRTLGNLGVTFVSKHIAWLEATGLVTASSSSRAAVQASVAQESANVQPYNNMLPALVGLGSLGALLLTVACLVLRPRRDVASVPARRGAHGSRATGSTPQRAASHAAR
jgi:predicted outer membrane protein